METIKKIAMIAFCITLLFCSASARVITNGVDLVEKDATNPLPDGSYPVIDGGASGTMEYACDDSFAFFGSYLPPNTNYALINYKEPYPGTGLIVLGTGVSSEKGNVYITGTFDIDALNYYTYPTLTSSEYSGITGAKIWLVPTRDLTGNQFNSWNPSTYLFETKLIVQNELRCGGLPSPKFPTVAFPAAVIVGIIGFVLINRREK